MATLTLKIVKFADERGIIDNKASGYRLSYSGADNEETSVAIQKQNEGSGWSDFYNPTSSNDKAPLEVDYVLAYHEYQIAGQTLQTLRKVNIYGKIEGESAYTLLVDATEYDTVKDQQVGVRGQITEFVNDWIGKFIKRANGKSINNNKYTNVETIIDRVLTKIGDNEDKLKRKRKANEDGLAKKRARTEALQQNAAARANAEASAAGNRGDGNFHYSFINMGQGDCALLTSPQGTTIMIDCGSEGGNYQPNPAGGNALKVGNVEDNLCEVISLPKHLGDPNPEETPDSEDDDLEEEDSTENPYPSRVLNHLIITHSDADHHNKLSVISGSISIENVYSNSVDQNDHAGTTKHKIQLIQANGQYLLKKDNTSHSEETIQVVSEKFGDENNGFQVHIIAGGVEHTYANNIKDWSSTPPNSASLVTLVKFRKDGKWHKWLFTGDATVSTEKFLVEHRAAYIRGLDLLQIPHHGSTGSTGYLPMINLCQPKSAYISAPFFTTNSYHHPGYLSYTFQNDSRHSYHTHLNKLGTAHVIGVWGFDDFRNGDTNNTNANMKAADDNIFYLVSTQKDIKTTSSSEGQNDHEILLQKLITGTINP